MKHTSSSSVAFRTSSRITQGLAIEQTFRWHGSAYQIETHKLAIKPEFPFWLRTALHYAPLPLGSEFGARRSTKTGTLQISVKLDWRPQVYCFVTSKSVVLFCSLSSKLALAVLPSAATVILKTPITLPSRLSVSSSVSLPIILTETLVTPGSPFIGASAPPSLAV